VAFHISHLHQIAAQTVYGFTLPAAAIDVTVEALELREKSGVWKVAIHDSD
jgi:hypothetical protein